MAVFVLIIFLPQDIDQGYQTQLSIRRQLLETELTRDIFFEDITLVDEWYKFMKDIYVPTIYRRTYYNGQSYPRNKAAWYQPYFVNEANLVLGITRIRQVRLRAASTCTVVSFLEDRFNECLGDYSADDEDTARWTFGARGLNYKSADKLDDGTSAWQSPLTLAWYDAGGYVVDLPWKAKHALDELESLQANGFIDQRTRAVFVDFTAYNPNNDHLFYGRLALEMLATGKVLASAHLDAGPVYRDNRALAFAPGSNKGALGALLLEFGLYALVALHLTRWVRKIVDFGSFLSYLRVPWNLMDMGMAFCVFALVVFRCTYMIRMANFQYDVADDLDDDELDYDSFVPLRVSMLMYRLSRNFLALAVLLAFLKAFKFLGVTKRLAQFADTVFRAYKSMLTLCFILGTICAGYAIAFHMAFGHAVARFQNFTESLLALLLSILGDFDLDELRAVNPILGVLLFVSYVLIVLFVTLSMMLKIVDDTYTSVVEDFAADGEENENLGMHLKYAFLGMAHDLYWWVKLKQTLHSARRLRATAQRLRADAGRSDLEVKLAEAAAQAKGEEAEQLEQEGAERRRRRAENRARGRGPGGGHPHGLNLRNLAEVREEEVAPESVEDRAALAHHRQAVVLKLATRLARAVEYRIGQQHGVQFDDNRNGKAVSGAQKIKQHHHQARGQQQNSKNIDSSRGAAGDTLPRPN
uniref:Uncharacterized protein n=1 Tax=Heterosigma akashiwo TaxID=2829 RepID=A0A6V1NN28_HETAK